MPLTHEVKIGGPGIQGQLGLQETLFLNKVHCKRNLMRSLAMDMEQPVGSGCNWPHTARASRVGNGTRHSLFSPLLWQ